MKNQDTNKNKTQLHVKSHSNLKNIMCGFNIMEFIYFSLGVDINQLVLDLTF